MVKLFFALVFISVSFQSVQAQSELTQQLNELRLKLDEVQPVNVYVTTRFGKEFKTNSVTIVGDSLFFTDFNRVSRFHARNIVELRFNQPHPYWKWVGAASGILLSAGVLLLVDSYFGAENYKFGAVEYGLGTATGGVVGYMIGRGIEAEEISFRF